MVDFGDDDKTAVGLGCIYANIFPWDFPCTGEVRGGGNFAHIAGQAAKDLGQVKAIIPDQFVRRSAYRIGGDEMQTKPNHSAGFLLTALTDRLTDGFQLAADHGFPTLQGVLAGYVIFDPIVAVLHFDHKRISPIDAPIVHATRRKRRAVLALYDTIHRQFSQDQATAELRQGREDHAIELSFGISIGKVDEPMRTERLCAFGDTAQ